jgi:hypothetical protein
MKYRVYVVWEDYKEMQGCYATLQEAEERKKALINTYKNLNIIISEKRLK